MFSQSLEHNRCYVSLRVEDVCLVLLQDVLAEAYATRRLLWESLVLPQLRDAGIDVNELTSRFVLQDDLAKDYAYSLAERIRQSQDTAKSDPPSKAI